MLAGVIAWEALQRLGDPPDVDGAIVLVVGLLGAAVNVGAAWALSRAERRSLNVQGARAHVLVDLYGSLGAALAGLLVLITGFDGADTIVALLVAALMVRSGCRACSARRPACCWRARRAGSTRRRSATRSPRIPASARCTTCTCGRSPRASRRSRRTCSFPPGEDCHARRAELEHLLAERFGLEHTTLQVEHEARRPACSTSRRAIRGNTESPGPPDRPGLHMRLLLAGLLSLLAPAAAGAATVTHTLEGELYPGGGCAKYQMCDQRYRWRGSSTPRASATT